eukprot:6196337-Pleurochrysis_carterae.AAC.3
MTMYSRYTNDMRVQLLTKRTTFELCLCQGQPRRLGWASFGERRRETRPSGRASALRVRAAWAVVFVSDRNEISIRQSELTKHHTTQTLPDDLL